MSSFGEMGSPQRKRRTREHVIEGLSHNHLERKVLLTGHVLLKPEHDYGVDAIMFHYSKSGEIENGEVRFQLKATDRLRLIGKGEFISFSIRTGDLHYWSLEVYPFILVVFDAQRELGYWLDIQEYVSARPGVRSSERESVQVRIPTANKLTTTAIKSFRRKSLKVVQSFQGQGGHDDGKGKPK